MAAQHVLVAVATYQRPEQLLRLLPKLCEQTAALDPPAQVLVVDNDPQGAAIGTVQPWLERGVSYVHEPIPGIAAARNRALTEAATEDALIFIDDDEVPQPGWLAALIACWQSSRVAAVTGPVLPRFAGPIDPWVRGSGVFEPRRHPSGTEVAGFATNNLLLDLTTVRRLGLRFEDHFGLSGGEDTMFSYSLRHRGEVIRWCAEAQVVDVIPADRATREWVRRRTNRTSATWSRVQLSLQPTAAGRARTRLHITALGAYRILRGTSWWTSGTLRRDIYGVGAAATEVRAGVYMTLGAFGRTPVEYRRLAITKTSHDQ